MLKKKQQEGSTWHQSEWPSLKGIQTKIAGEDVDKREASYAVGGTVNWYQPLWRTVGRFLKKLKIEPAHDSAIPLLGM